MVRDTRFAVVVLCAAWGRPYAVRGAFVCFAWERTCAHGCVRGCPPLGLPHSRSWFFLFNFCDWRPHGVYIGCQQCILDTCLSVPVFGHKVPFATRWSSCAGCPLGVHSQLSLHGVLLGTTHLQGCPLLRACLHSCFCKRLWTTMEVAGTPWRLHPHLQERLQ